MAYIGQSLTEGTRRAYTFVATSGQTTFNAVFGVGAVDVYQNGILLQPSDYNSSSGSSVVLGVGAAVNDEITIIAHNTFSVADTVSSSQGGTFTGAVTASNGLTVDDDGATPLTVDRATNNGDIIDLQKDGTAVGSIGTQYGFLGIGTQNTGVYYHPTVPAIVPCNPSSAFVNRDSAIDIGVSNVRFKDLYLSGGAYLGGTGSANKLDDYEIGDYTPAKNNGGSVGYSAQNGHYTKVGELVTVYMDMTISSASGESGSTSVTLPFTSKSGNNYMTFNPWIVDTGFTGSSETASGFINGSTGFMYMYKIASGNSSGAGFINNNVTGRWSGVFTYFTA